MAAVCTYVQCTRSVDRVGRHSQMTSVRSRRVRESALALQCFAGRLLGVTNVQNYLHAVARCIIAREMWPTKRIERTGERGQQQQQKNKEPVDNEGGYGGVEGAAITNNVRNSCISRCE
ncbi:hypothetical protein HETIRDRAFT_432223 [Heterobasidion irregulare TC 32-1]|uniref:Uncharacterized protein n=1 Tax=Heterobasidion irregulare (strain TC 32-1) TaxID=747525 RepID=W4KHZ9_HETIT|nr:uncharacterized protein HETIRDRAFT_432223 [Heterobasidion irregulare TC 32-1]ETW85488.1 hypothetical protein HETIRDRAFT_432223 [Heterobasidion irregulare TC 32-1]